VFWKQFSANKYFLTDKIGLSSLFVGLISFLLAIAYICWIQYRRATVYSTFFVISLTVAWITALGYSASGVNIIGERMLVNYPRDLPQLISRILRNSTQLGYKGPAQFILSKNLISADLDNDTIQDKLAADLKAGRVVAVSLSSLYICSLLGLVPKHSNGWRRIHYLSYPIGRSVNDHIRPDFATLKYVILEEIWATIVKTGRGSTIIKHDIQDIFRMILVAELQQWLLGFQVDGRYSQETYLLFGLSISPFLFNIFNKAFY
jgi:hypothetical protein